MKPEISTAVMIEGIRQIAGNGQSTSDNFLNLVADRIELLLASESGMSLELNSVRCALDIPPGESVQSGVVKELTRLNTEILALRSELAELQNQEPFMYGIMTPDGRAYFDEFCVCEDKGLLEDEIYYLNEDMADGEPKYSVVPLYAAPVPPAPTISFYRDGIETAAKWVDKQREAYDSEHGRHDPDTGTFEFGNDAQQEHSSTLVDIAEGIRALHPNAAAPQHKDGDA
ncbi:MULTISPECIES: hypothetical protein [Brenneria]|uniref:hypothetical protein n=1 Tax=Brenneria TaxID=71655 RepID=UPI00022F761C|nr:MULTISPECIES: hypothetical protein [Brenneria]EHD21808.1 hypothetical protein BrE312_2428 [Brenneria sp. EniD312]